MWRKAREKRSKRTTTVIRDQTSRCKNERIIEEVSEQENLQKDCSNRTTLSGTTEPLSPSDDEAEGDSESEPEERCIFEQDGADSTKRMELHEVVHHVIMAQRMMKWASMFRRADPRHKIFTFFHDLTQKKGGADEFNLQLRGHTSRGGHVSPSFFTVWRPTSMDAIRLMMKKEAVGKTLEIKGKSARAGKLSAFVPFLQIHKEKDKSRIRTIPKDARMLIYYRSAELRECARKELAEIAIEMIEGFLDSRKTLNSAVADEAAREAAMECFMWEMTNSDIVITDEYVKSEAWGLEIHERLFWEAYVVRRDITREDCSEYDTKRPSSPAFQDMNLKAISYPKKGKSHPVVWQRSVDDPMCPLNLLVACKEQDRVLPVVSDFDCFLMGTRGITYNESLPPNQIEMLENEVSCIEQILDDTRKGESWTNRWLDLLKTQPPRDIPKYGLGDPISYRIMQQAIDSLFDEGSVRHGAECFNYCFPQELDSDFLIISDDLPGMVPWRYVDGKELQNFLLQKVEDGFTFPMNIKWVLCDEGWKSVYDKLMSSDMPGVRDSMDVWFPNNGLRERIEQIHARHPNGFESSDLTETEMSGSEAMDLAEMELKYYRTWQRAKLKLRVILLLMKLSSKRADEASID